MTESSSTSYKRSLFIR